MRASVVLYFSFTCVYSLPTRPTSQLDTSWTLFKCTYAKRYPSNQEELNRWEYKIFLPPLVFIIIVMDSRAIWEGHVTMIRKHNREADLGLHSYTWGINQFSDMVGFYSLFICICRVIYAYVDKWRIQQTNERSWYKSERFTQKY